MNNQPGYEPRKFNEEVREKYLDLLRKGMRPTAAARGCGVSYNTVWEYKRAYPDFVEEVKKAEAVACEVVEDALMKKIVEDGHFPAMVYWLAHRSNGAWTDLKAGKIESAIESRADADIMKDIVKRLEKPTKPEKTDEQLYGKMD